MIPEFYHKIVPTAIPEDYKIVVFQKSIFPEISIGLAESYCVEKNCDCRHVFISVILKGSHLSLSVSFHMAGNQLSSMLSGCILPKMMTQ